jgi:hypothetical protein
VGQFSSFKKTLGKSSGRNDNKNANQMHDIQLIFFACAVT